MIIFTLTLTLSHQGRRSYYPFSKLDRLRKFQLVPDRAGVQPVKDSRVWPFLSRQVPLNS
jgi:hypothetical protein